MAGFKLGLGPERYGEDGVCRGASRYEDARRKQNIDENRMVTALPSHVDLQCPGHAAFFSLDPLPKPLQSFLQAVHALEMGS